MPARKQAVGAGARRARAGAREDHQVRSSVPRRVRKPFFDFRGATETDDGFTRTAVAMEDLTVALLGGVTPRIQDRGLTAALFGLLTVEARHAAWARNIVGATPAAARSTSRARSTAVARSSTARASWCSGRARPCAAAPA